MSYQKHNFEAGAVLFASQLNDMDNQIEVLSNQESTLSENFKVALLNCFENVAWVTQNGQSYYNELYNALYPDIFWTVTNTLSGCTNSNNATNVLKNSSYIGTIIANQGYTLDSATVNILMGGNDVTNLYYSSGSINIPNVTGDLVITVTATSAVVSISAVFTQGNVTIFDIDGYDKLRQYLVVTANYSDSTSETVTTYSLYGEMTAGTTPITVEYGGKTTTFNVVITSTALPSEYTKKAYIASKTTSTQNATAANYIKLKAYDNIHVLSMEFDMAFKSTTIVGQGCMGARTNASGYDNSYSVYCQTAETGVAVVARGFTNPSGIFSTERVRYRFENPLTSPAYLYANDVLVLTREWTNTPTVNAPMVLFNNFPTEDTSTQWAINPQVKIGTIIFRKADGECVGYFIPCVYSNKIGMYNIMDSTFYTAATATAVTIGNSNCKYTVADNW